MWTPKLCRMLTIFGIVPSMVLILIFGILAGSKTGHFRTAHGVSRRLSLSTFSDHRANNCLSQVLGLITLLVAIAAVALYLYSKPAALTPGDPIPGSSQLTRITLASNLCNQLLLILLAPAAITGFADLSSVTLCLTRVVVTFEMAISLGLGLGFVYTLGQFVSSSELFLIFRASRKAKKAATGGVREKIRRVEPTEEQ